MKALDTPVLLAVLEGEPGARELLRKLRGVEVATTEANLLELAYIAGRGGERHRAARRDALVRLRRKVTVLPIDARAVEAAARQVGRGAEREPPLVSAMMGALEAYGCEELLTSGTASSQAKWKIRVTRIQMRSTK